MNKEENSGIVTGSAIFARLDICSVNITENVNSYMKEIEWIY